MGEPAAEQPGHAAPAVDQAGSLNFAIDGAATVIGYDRATFERFMVEVDRERARLRAEIELAGQRLAAAEARLGPTAELEEHVGRLVIEAYRELAAEDDEHRSLVLAIAAAAERQAAAIRADGAQRAAAIETMLSSVDPGPLASVIDLADRGANVADDRRA